MRLSYFILFYFIFGCVRAIWIFDYMRFSTLDIWLHMSVTLVCDLRALILKHVN